MIPHSIEDQPFGLRHFSLVLLELIRIWKINYNTIDIDLEIMLIQKAGNPSLPDHIVGCSVQSILISQPIIYHLSQQKFELLPLSSAQLLGWPTHSLLQLIDLLLATVVQ